MPVGYPVSAALPWDALLGMFFFSFRRVREQGRGVLEWVGGVMGVEFFVAILGYGCELIGDY